ncbi:MAG: 16S rRNA (uracil(1498)-N(3))-methyltransferase [Thermodesulfobacteriota bacterium]
MPRFPIAENQVNNDEAFISGTDYKHIVKVLRLKPGDKITLFDSSSRQYYCKIREISKRDVVVDIERTEQVNTESPIEITLLQGLPKGDKMDYIIEKATELGVSRIVPVITQRAQIRERDRKKRWDRIALEASKQCGRTNPAIIENTLDFEGAINLYSKKELAVILHANYEVTAKGYIKNSLQAPQSIVLFVGPEGGFTDNEVLLGNKMGFMSLGLGPRVLRTETASIAVLSVLQFHYGDL